MLCAAPSSPHVASGKVPPVAIMRLLIALLFTLFAVSTLAVREPTSYCKCICFQNSTIIPLNSPPDTSSSSPGRNLHVREDDTTDSGKKHRALTCNDCNRAFCLDYNLPICKNAKEEDVFATCFRMCLYILYVGMSASILTLWLQSVIQ